MYYYIIGIHYIQNKPLFPVLKSHIQFYLGLTLFILKNRLTVHKEQTKHAITHSHFRLPVISREEKILASFLYTAFFPTP